MARSRFDTPARPSSRQRALRRLDTVSHLARYHENSFLTLLGTNGKAGSGTQAEVCNIVHNHEDGGHGPGPSQPHPAAFEKQVRALLLLHRAAYFINDLIPWRPSAGSSGNYQTHSLSAQADESEVAMIIPVILSGGVGSRLWPLSREHFPKQLIPITGGEYSLFQETVQRLSGIADSAPPIVVCNESHRFMIAAQMQAVGVGHSAIILEPVGRNTCPAITVAALEAARNGDDPILLVVPADHIISDAELFASAVHVGEQYALDGSIITFGVVPDRPETGYGYIKKGECSTSTNGQNGGFAVREFTEKPELELARAYVDSGEYYWNSGMFMFRASTFLEEMESFSPAILEACTTAHNNAWRDLDFIRLDEQAFSSSPSDSIDYAVLEKTSRAVVIPLDIGWSDVGSWMSLHEVCQQDACGNVINGDVLLEDVQNCYIHSDSRLVAALGIQNQIIIETKDAVLVCAIDRSQDVKLIVNRLKSQMRDEAFTHLRAYRPWGYYECMDTGDRFKVKRITVNPGAALSLQMHYHRAEHWIVVKGTARIVKGDKAFLINEDQSTYIPCGTNHRLENPGKIPLELIEVQTGSYLGEDDICRFEDNYGRIEG